MSAQQQGFKEGDSVYWIRRLGTGTARHPARVISVSQQMAYIEVDTVYGTRVKRRVAQRNLEATP